MIIITSAAYISPGLITEFGKLPPTMLPLQNKRLFQHQLEIFNKDEDIIISLPSDFELTQRDSILLRQQNVAIVYVPIGLSLGQSVVYVLNVAGRYNESLKILHGDTLFKHLPEGEDVCLVAEVHDNYNWTFSSEIDADQVYAGYFSFSNQSLLIQKVTENNYDFMMGVESYKKQRAIAEVFTDFWLDFGMVNTYHRSKSFLTTQRVFNDLTIGRYSVKKYSKDKNKIFAEANWFQNAPANLKPFIPALWNYGEVSERAYYEIEYFYLNTLADLYVFGHQPFFVWKGLINACVQFIDACWVNHPPESEVEIGNIENFYAHKTESRLKEYSLENGIDLNATWCLNGQNVPSINEIVAEMNAAIPNPDKRHLCLMHGDFCFSNILFNFKTQSIKVIDPRGLDLQGRKTIYGDLRYDVAKLAHSILGLYDYIIGGCFTLREHSKYSLEFSIQTESNVINIQQYFKTINFGKRNLDELSTYPIMVHLFLSMLPLHSDHPIRQKALLANAFRLYKEYHAAMK